MAIIPKVLTNMNLFIEGKGYAGKVEKLKLPKVAVKTEEYRGGGMDAPVAIDVGMEKLETEWTLKEADADALKLFGLGHGKRVKVAFRGALEKGQGEADPLVAKMEGEITEMEPDEWEAGKAVSWKFKMNVQFYELLIAGEEIYHIDIINQIRRIGGKDYMEGVRAALGL